MSDCGSICQIGGSRAPSARGLNPQTHLLGASIISPSKTQKAPSPKALELEEKRRVSRQLAVLALSWMKQDETMTVREREELRRCLASAAQFMDWRSHGQEPTEIATKDALKLARAGARMLVKDLADELDAKKKEITALKRSAREIHKLAETGDFEEPMEVTYIHTFRKPSLGLVTKEEVIEVTKPEEATSAANTIETKLEMWTKLRDEMIVELKKQQKDLEAMRKKLPAFINSSGSLLQHVFATLY